MYLKTFFETWLMYEVIQRLNTLKLHTAPVWLKTPTSPCCPHLETGAWAVEPSLEEARATSMTRNVIFRLGENTLSADTLTNV